MWAKLAKLHQRFSVRGQSLLEFSVMLIVLLILFSGIIDVGRALVAYYSLKEAAAEGATYGSVCPITDYVVGRTKNSLNTFQADELSVTVTCNDGACNSSTESGATITVTVEYDLKAVTPFATLFFPSNTYHISVSEQQIVLTSPAKRTTFCTP